MDLPIHKSQIVTIDVLMKQDTPVMVYIYTPVLGVIYAAGYDNAAREYIHNMKTTYHTHMKTTKM